MTELPYPYTITHGHEPTPPLQTAIEKINVYSSQYAHLSPSECAALRAELKRLKSDMQSQGGEIGFLRAHLKDILSHILNEVNEGNIVSGTLGGEAYDPRFSKTRINGMWYEMGFWKDEDEVVND